ncbi:DUF2892 domain-containing protein [Candidatus Aerophobetes bacterium]|nr:DUF2892 domain-containing protein [Candidatus Aerophobetes bacterium]
MRKKARNIGKLDRIIRLLAGFVLFVLGAYTWNPVVLFFAGFCFFQAIWSWCGLYATIGKNTCPV